MADRENNCLEYIRSSVTPGAKVLLLLSGGVDSTVCAALVNKALDAEHVVALHIDTGFMRENESNEVIASLSRLGIKVLCVLQPHAEYHTILLLYICTCVQCTLYSTILYLHTSPADV